MLIGLPDLAKEVRQHMRQRNSWTLMSDDAVADWKTSCDIRISCFYELGLVVRFEDDGWYLAVVREGCGHNMNYWEQHPCADDD